MGVSLLLVSAVFYLLSRTIYFIIKFYEDMVLFFSYVTLKSESLMKPYRNLGTEF